ncbi:MAG: hypothetical protein CL431_08900 [Acidimicrobiaceae bacterium]|jgi:hypothetical protein|nr:hypothetical protein [Acidimicrobiaceae bacterium]|tara:strand:+ start:123812 stop:124363 length:552 start_codon:yes stop_codon:yes gene_type:complete
MSEEYEKAVKELLAKDQIKDLVFRYSDAIRNRDIELLVNLYSPNASFGDMGVGETALRAMSEATLTNLQFAVILVANHLITFDNETEAKGEVWARCYAQNEQEGYYEQLIKYVDQYELVDSSDGFGASWKFRHRRHYLWFGQSKDSPLILPEASWPDNNVGLGREPLSDELVQALRKQIDEPS